MIMRPRRPEQYAPDLELWFRRGNYKCPPYPKIWVTRKHKYYHTVCDVRRLNKNFIHSTAPIMASSKSGEFQCHYFDGRPRWIDPFE